jgi:diguanylate cyclase (GGDEF)-like protein
LANVDALTGLATRRNILQIAEREISRARRNRAQLALLLLDLDYFKNVNDTHGHAAGDRVLSSVARALVAEMRTTDCLGRWGGEELVAVLYGSGAAHTEVISERLRSRVENLQIPVCDGIGKISVTVSIGAAQWSPFDESLDSLLKRADIALYNAKNNGRNKVTLSDIAISTAP